MVVMRLVVVTGALVHSSPGDEKEWSVGRLAAWPELGQVAGLVISLPDQQSGLAGAVTLTPRPHVNVTKLENVYQL